MPKSERFEEQTAKEDHKSRDKAQPDEPTLQRIPRAGAFIFTDGTSYYYDRPNKAREKFATMTEAKEHGEKDLKKNPLNWRKELLTR